jgi:glycosyltransferase involved in cell wall biosynthesis
MRNIRVSVLMPAYNAEKYITEAIDSILAQTFSDFEFIIINDGSTDKTPEIVRSYKDSRIVFVDNTKNQGLIAVLNQGLDICRGEYVARMDSDDISMPERFTKQVAYLDAHPDVGICGTLYTNFGAVKESTATQLISPRALDFVRGCRFCHASVMLRKAMFDQYGLRYNPDYIACEDYELWTRAIRYMKAHNIQESLLRYRISDISISSTKKQLMTDNSHRVRQNMLDFLTTDNVLQKHLVSAIRTRWVGIPLMAIRHKENKTVWRLFGFIPVWVRRHLHEVD